MKEVTRLFPDPRFLLFVLQNILPVAKMRLNVCFVNEMALFGSFAALSRAVAVIWQN